MDLGTVFVVLLLAVLVGLAGALLTSRRDRATTAALSGVRRELEEQRGASLGTAVEHLVTMAREQLVAQSDAGLAQLDSRNELMDQRLDAMHRDLDKVTALVRDLETDRQRQFGELTEQLSAASRTTAELAQTTQSLRQALASPQARGQWGERMADDVLRTAGLVEGVNYLKQASTASGRPDVTFLLPQGRRLHMDVKFPLDNYLRMLEADHDADRDRCAKIFLRDVRNRVKDLAGRDYVDPTDGTLGYVLLFIPNEHVYGFVHDRDRQLLDHALANHVVLCSPLTLFAVLAVIRQAVDSFNLESKSRQILEVLGSFGQQWDRFTEAMEVVGRRLDSTRRAYDDLNGARRRQLERQLDRVDDLRRDEPAQVVTADDRPADVGRLIRLDEPRTPTGTG